MTSMSYSYKKTYHICQIESGSISNKYGQLADLMHDDVMWLAGQIGTRWHYNDHYISGGFIRTFKFISADDFALFQLARG